MNEELRKDIQDKMEDLEAKVNRQINHLLELASMVSIVNNLLCSVPVENDSQTDELF